MVTGSQKVLQALRNHNKSQLKVDTARYDDLAQPQQLQEPLEPVEEPKALLLEQPDAIKLRTESYEAFEELEERPFSLRRVKHLDAQQLSVDDVDRDSDDLYQTPARFSTDEKSHAVPQAKRLDEKDDSGTPQFVSKRSPPIQRSQ